MLKSKIIAGDIKLWKVIIIPLVIFIAFIQVHEYTHYTIFRVYECENIEVGFYKLQPGVSADINTCSNKDAVMLLQSITEIVGYTLGVFLTFISVLVWCILEYVKNIEHVELI